jgi:hypothetical protein
MHNYTYLLYNHCHFMLFHCRTRHLRELNVGTASDKAITTNHQLISHGPGCLNSSASTCTEYRLTLPRHELVSLMRWVTTHRLREDGWREPPCQCNCSERIGHGGGHGATGTQAGSDRNRDSLSETDFKLDSDFACFPCTCNKWQIMVGGLTARMRLEASS